jgi:hypothetical protein
MAIAYRSPKELARFYAPIKYPKIGIAQFRATNPTS